VSAFFVLRCIHPRAWRRAEGTGTETDLTIPDATRARQTAAVFAKFAVGWFAVLFWMVAIWRAIQNKTANSYVIEIAI